MCMARRGPPWHLSSVSPLSEKRAGVGEAREEGDRHVGHIGRHKHGVEDTRGAGAESERRAEHRRYSARALAKSRRARQQLRPHRAGGREYERPIPTAVYPFILRGGLKLSSEDEP